MVCQDCNARYLWPRITGEQLDVLYGKSYFTGFQGNDGGLNIPSSNSDYEVEFAEARLGKFEDTVHGLLELNPNAKCILDIGAATGDFLAIAQKRDLAVSGIELSDYASEKAKLKYGFVFHKISVDDYRGDEKYDLIHLNHVFEHFNFPHKSLDRICDLLNSNGKVYVEVPFQFNLIEVIKYLLTRQKKNFDVFSLHHPLFYTPRTLKKVFEEHNLRCIKLNVFKWSRYPATGIVGHLKRLMWLGASLVGQGVFIEAIFERKLNK